jgi:hypothetical protein
VNNLDAIPWYKSAQQIGLVTTAISAIIAMFPKAGQLLGLSSPTDVSIIGTFIRARSTVQPLTLTQSGADIHPNTLANAQAPLPVTKATS